MGNNKSAQEFQYLKEKDLCFLEANTKYNRDKIIQWHNAFLQDCPTGYLFFYLLSLAKGDFRIHFQSIISIC